MSGVNLSPAQAAALLRMVMLGMTSHSRDGRASYWASSSKCAGTWPRSPTSLSASLVPHAEPCQAQWSRPPPPVSHPSRRRTWSG